MWSFNGLYSEIIPADQPQASLASVGICNGDLIYLLPRDAMMQQLQEEPQSRPNLSPNNNAQLHSPSLRTPLVTQPSPKAFKSSVQSAASALPAPSTVNASGLDQELFKLRFNRDFEAWNSPTSLAADLESSLLPQINESLSSPYLYMFLFVHSMLLEIGLSFCQSSYPSGVDNSSATLGKQLTGTKSPSHTLSLTYILPAAVLPTSNSTSSSNVTQHQERASPNAGGRLVQLRMHQLGSFLTIIVFLDTDNHVRLDLNLSGTFYSQSSASCDVQVPHECSICAVGVRRTESTEAALRDRVQVLPIGRSSGRQWFAVAGEGRLYALRVALIDRLYLPVRAIVRRGVCRDLLCMSLRILYDTLYLIAYIHVN